MDELLEINFLSLLSSIKGYIGDVRSRLTYNLYRRARMKRKRSFSN